MNYTLFIIIFTICVFMYIHIKYQRKICKDNETIIMQIPTKESLDDVCNVRLPTKFPNHFLTEILNISLTDIQREFTEPIDLNIFNVEYGPHHTHHTQPQDNSNRITNTLQTTELSQLKGNTYVPLDIENTIQLFDNEDTYVTEHNYSVGEYVFGDMLNDNEKFIRPTLTCKRKIDILSGSIKAFTFLQHHIYYRNYIFVTNGKIKIRLIHPRFLTQCKPDFDLNDMMFRYKDDIWRLKPEQSKLHKIQFLELEATQGDVVYIPPFWGYSIQYEDKNTFALRIHYQTIMNMVSNTKEHALSLLQRNNTRVIAKQY